MKKPTWLKDSIAKEDGYYSKKGERLKVAKLSKEEVDAWNGVKKAAPVIEVAKEVVEEKVEEVQSKMAERIKSILNK